MDADELDDLFGRIALEKDFITEGELKDALEAIRHLRELDIEDKTLIDVMLQKGYVSNSERDEIFSQLERARTSVTSAHGYQVLLEIERERPGKLYKAYQRSMDRMVCLRILSKKDSAQAQFIPGLKREARLLATCTHPGIVSGYDAGETDEEYFLVSEFVEGSYLSGLLEREGLLKEERALKIGLSITRALECLEEHSIVHRDIEPANILVTESNEAKIISLALAVPKEELVHAARENEQTITPYYMAPEQAKGFTDLDVRSDLFSLGATLYHMLTGQRPFGDDPEMALTHIVTKEAPDPRSINPEITLPTSHLVTKLMQKKKEFRHQNPAEIRMQIEKILAAGVPSGAVQAKSAKPARTRRRRVRQASKKLAAQAAAPKPLPPRPAAPVPLPPKPEPAFTEGAAKGGREQVRPRGVALAAAKASRSNTALIAIIGLVVALVIIIVVASSMPESGPTRVAPVGRKPRQPAVEEPTVSEVLEEDFYPEDVKQFRKLRREQNKHPESLEVIAKYEKFLTEVKNPEIKKAAIEARKSMLNALYSTTCERGEKLRREHRYSEAVGLYRRLLRVIPESEKAAIQVIKAQIDKAAAEVDLYYTRESSRAEGLIDRGEINAAIAIYERLMRNTLGEHSRIAAKVVVRLKDQKATGRAGHRPPGTARPATPEDRTIKEIEADQHKKEAEAKLHAFKQRIIAELQSKVSDCVRKLRMKQARKLVEKTLKEKTDPAFVEAARRITGHLDIVDKVLEALEAYMKKLYKKSNVEIWLKKRQVLRGELLRYDSGILTVKKRNDETVHIRLSDIREDELERYILDGFGDKSAENLLRMAVFFLYFYGDSEVTQKYLTLARTKGANIQEYAQLLRRASFGSALADAQQELQKKNFFLAYMKLSQLRSDFAKTAAYKQQAAYIEELTEKAYKSSGLGNLFAGKLTCRVPDFQTFYDFTHSSQLNDFAERTWDVRGAHVETPMWTLRDDTLVGGGDSALIWSGRVRDEISLSFFAEPRLVGPFEILLLADPEKPYKGRAYAFGFSSVLDTGDKAAAPEHYIALWDGRKGHYKYLKRGIPTPELEEKKTYLIQIIVRHHTLQLFIDEKLLGEVKDTTLDAGTVVLRVGDSLVRFDNLTIKAHFDRNWLKKAAKNAR